MTTAKKSQSKKIAAAKKAVASHNRRIARDNAAFEKMTPAQKRVQIARDVIAQIDASRLVPKFGTWLSTKNNGPLVTPSSVKDSNAELKDVLSKVKQCTGCAIGGMFMCAVERADKLKIKELSDFWEEEGCDKNTQYVDIDDTDAFEYLSRFFSAQQLSEIEAAFERNGGIEFHDLAGDFAPECEEPAERMRLIMQSIIVGNGKFDITKQPRMTYIVDGYEE